MLSPLFASMDCERFALLPDTTNAVEAHNRISKSSHGPESLQVALLTLYKKDMIVVLRAMAEKSHIPTSYEDRTPAARAKRVMSSNAARKRRFANRNDNAEGPPDRNSDYKDGKLKRKATSSDNKGAKRKKTHQKEEETVTVANSGDEDNQEDPLWVKSLNLTESCREKLMSGAWLTTDIMDAASQLVRESFPDLKGLQPTLRAKSKQRGFIPQTQGSLQIHHSEQAQHWVTSCFLDEEVKLYDSLPPSTKKLTTDLKKQLRAIYATDGELAVTVPVVQRQKGGSDCGVFAIAYLFHLALGDKPEELIFDQAMMRGHLAMCFERRSVFPFPNTPKRSRTSKHIIRV